MSYGYDPELTPWIDLLPDVDFAELDRVRRVEAEIMEFGQYEPPAPVDGVRGQSAAHRPRRHH